MSVQEICRVAENTQLGDGLFLMVLHAPKITELAQCGQFVHIACGEGHLLRRPISICAWKAPELRIVFQVKGEGTKWLSERRTGDELDVLGPLGHGFDVGALGSAPVFIGGGIGVPPMLGCVREAVKQGAKPAAILGFRNQGAVILEGDFRDECETFVTTDDGSYAYTIDFRSTSSTWTDEFTVEDDLTAAIDGRAQLTSITTPQALEDYDGKMNVWYKTDKTPENHVDESGANATLSDGHENPWLSDEATAATLGEDGRAVDFTGWKLWRADVPTTEATELSVADLGLEDDEHVTAIRFEYGRVESGFTTRDGGWDRDGIKDAHDDIASAEDTAKENGSRPDSSGGKAETALAPAIVHMKATDGYTAGRALDNYARVDLFRNGGGDGLEGHDEDQVTQTAKAVTVPPTNLDQTGRNVIIGLAAALAVAAAAAAALIYRRRTRGSAADDDEPDDDGYGREDYGHEDRHGDGYDRDRYGYDDRYRDEIRDRY